MRFGLYGIYGVYNFGCEAIVRGTYKFLKDSCPNGEILYFTYNFEYDSKRLSDLDIRIIEIVQQKNIVVRALNKALSMIEYEHRILPFNWKEVLEQVDVIISIGGDMYTIPEAVRKREKYLYYNSLVDFCNRGIRDGKQVVVYGASMGPWGSYQRAIDYYTRNISKYSAIICREFYTLKYLNDMGVNNAVFQPDPAFLVFLEDTVQNVQKKKYIGINFSPLSLRELYGSYSDEMIVRFKTLVEIMIAEFDSEILFIPHVISYDETDNDELMLQKLYSRLPEDLQKKVTIANTDGGFLGIKRQLQECKFVVATRMHCAINAINESVPAIFLSYSSKSQGIADYVYGSRKWVLSIKEIDTKLIPLMREMNAQWSEMGNEIGKRICEIREEYNQLQKEQHLFD